jgi:hypothetical protein
MKGEAKKTPFLDVELGAAHGSGRDLRPEEIGPVTFRPLVVYHDN